LSYNRASKTISNINRRKKAQANIPRAPARSSNDLDTPSKEIPRGEPPTHVKFSPSTDERYLERTENLQETSTSVSASGSTTPLGGKPDPLSTNALAKTLASKLSFWNPQPSADSIASLATSESSPPPSPALLGALLAPTPNTMEKRHSELEDKVIREIAKQYTRSGMYFAYTFGT
jgi:hypothetical protein